MTASPRILRLDSSASGASSVTSNLNALLVETLLASNPGATVVHRDLTELPVLNADRFAANSTPTGERSAEQRELAKLSDALIDELVAADIVVIAAPIYNFGIPGAVKAWADLVARASVTFTYTETGPQGLLTGKKAYVVSSSGGVELGSEMDFATPHLTLFLNFLGIADISLVDAGGLIANPNKVAEAENQIRSLASQ